MAGGKAISHLWLPLLSAGLVFWAVPGSGYAEQPAPGVEVQFSDQAITVKVNHPTPLLTVLEELCR